MSEENVTVESTDIPEEILETIKQGTKLRADLAGRLGALKGILDNIENRVEETPIISDENQVNLSLLQVEKSIMIIQVISRDLRDIITLTGYDTQSNQNAHKTLTKITEVYDSVVDKLGR
jgi:hypothetical protein